MQMPDDILSSLEITPADGAGLPAKIRTVRIANPLRWEQLDAARGCPQQLMVTHSRVLPICDSLARVYPTQGQPSDLWL
jgi:hypothetical protein